MSKFLKWAGGKASLLPQLRPLIPAFDGTYYEPFIGGGAMFFDLAPRHAVIGDANTELINCYRMVRNDPGEVIKIAECMIDAHDADTYYAVRANYNNKRGERSDAWWAAALIYLNRTCFNGVYRVNRKGEFNVPIGSYKNPSIDADAIRAASKALQGMNIFSGGYVAHAPRRDDFVYLDPPYDEAFNYGVEFDQRALADWFKRCLARCMLSNSDTELVNSLYSGYRITHIEAKRSVRPGLLTTGEVVVCNW